MSDRQAGAAGREEPGGPLFWVGVVVGWALIAAGVAGLFREHLATNPSGFARVFLGAAVVHDALVAPVVCAAGVVLARLLRPPFRGVVQGALVATVLVLLYTWPFVRGYGRAATNPTALPLNYGRGVVVLLAVVWLTAGAVLVWLRRRGQEAPG